MTRAATKLKGKIRPAAVAGQFYPEDEKELEKMIDKFLIQVEPSKIEGEVFGLLLPHAGYIYSGPVAAYGAKVVAGKNFDTVVIIGDSHYERFDGVSVWPEGEWETPLGKVKVDENLAQKVLSASKRFFTRDSAHLWEHSIEVQLPFLQRVLKNFRILPIIFGSEDEDWQELARVILENIKDPEGVALRPYGAGKKVLIIASADLSHYLPYEEAKEIDKKTLNNILDLQTRDLEVCAKDSVKTLIEITKSLGGRAQLLKYANSGDTAGDRTQVVGYGAVAFYLPVEAELLHIAKTSVETFIKEGKVPEFEVHSEKLKEKRGVFVTIKKGGGLRGCIGCLVGDKPLYQTVSQMAVAAAVEDPRFPPVTQDELPELEYEISVLTPLRKINSPKEIQLGVHGVQAVAGYSTGLFLPQVVTENNWDLETFLQHLMLKAGLPPNYWEKNPIDFYIFEAEVFSETTV